MERPEDHDSTMMSVAGAGDHDRVSHGIDNQLQREDVRHSVGPPDEAFAYAVIAGLATFDDRGLSDLQGINKSSRRQRHALIPFFRTPHEEVFLWRARDKQRWRLVTRVSPDVKTMDWWKTAASCLRLACTLRTWALVIPEAELYWLRDFDPAKTVDEHALYGVDPIPPYLLPADHMLDLEEMQGMLPLVEASLRDDKFYAASQHLVSALTNHPVCLPCLLGSEVDPMHPHHEPELWEVADWVSSMEIAIVQATRACETLLGQPGKRLKKREAAFENWRSEIALDPSDGFAGTGTTYFEFYCDLFRDHRDGAAHGNEGFRYHIRRRDCLHTLVLAWSVVQGRYRRIAAPVDEVAERLRVNPALLAPAAE